MNRQQAREAAKKCVESINRNDMKALWEVLDPILDVKVPFPLLDEMGKILGEAGNFSPSKYLEVFDEIFAKGKMGGYVILGQALGRFLDVEFETSLSKAKEYIAKGAEWYVCDIIGERVLGPALVNYFEKTLPYLEGLTREEDRWVRRSIGVAVHFFAKKRPKDKDGMRKLLALSSLLIEDHRKDVVKGVGWGLKTIGRHQPRLMEEYLQEVLKSKRVSKLTLRKATTYLDEKVKENLLKNWRKDRGENRLGKDDKHNRP